MSTVYPKTDVEGGYIGLILSSGELLVTLLEQSAEYPQSFVLAMPFVHNYSYVQIF